MKDDKPSDQVVTVHGSLAQQLAVEVSMLKGGKRKANIKLLEACRDALGEGQFREAVRR